MTTTNNLTSMIFNQMSENKYGTITPAEGEFYITPEADYALNTNVVHKTGDETITGTKTFSGNSIITNKEIIVTDCQPNGQFRAIKDNYGCIIRNDGSSTYFLLTDSGNQYGTWNNLRPFRIVNDTGDVMINSSKVTAFVTTKWISGTSWYKVWNDGWIEQGGQSEQIADYGTATVTLSRAFKNTNYTITSESFYNKSGDDTNWMGSYYIHTKTTSTFKIYSRSALNGGRFVMWYACGY